MLRVWNAPVQRPTKDIDLLGKTSNEIEDLEKFVKECCQTEVEDDGVIFDLESIKGEPIKKQGMGSDLQYCNSTQSQCALYSDTTFSTSAVIRSSSFILVLAAS